MSGYHDSHVVELAGKILIVSIVVLSVVLIFVFFIHLYAKWFWYRLEEDPSASDTRRRRRRGDFAAGHQEQQSGVTVLRRGLNPSFLKTIPVVTFDPKDFKEGLECAVCLSELSEGEQTRILPKCSHGFHVECIDMWFHSHSTCPICRNPVSDETVISVENLLGNRQTQEESSTDSGDSHDFPTNILFWGDGTEISTFTSQLEEANSHHQPPILASEPASSSSSSSPSRTNLVIDIPPQNDYEEDQKSPVSSRMRSLRRILSGSRKFINPFSPATNNVEQGTGGHL